MKLGGPNYRRAKAMDAAGKQMVGQQGYMYFGAAQNLPGVRELFEKEELETEVRKTRKELFKDIKPDYYGWRDEDDANLLLAENAAEMELQQKAISEWQQSKGGSSITQEELAERKRRLAEEAEEMSRAYVSVPTNEDIEEMMLEKKKQSLLDKYMSSDAQQAKKDTEELVAGKSPPQAAQGRFHEKVGPRHEAVNQLIIIFKIQDIYLIFSNYVKSPNFEHFHFCPDLFVDF